MITGKKIVLTGANSGIGLETLKLLVQGNNKILAVDLKTDVISTFDQSKVFPMQCDVGNKEGIDKIFEVAKEKLGTIDIFYANAGFPYYEQYNYADWDRVNRMFQVNTISPMYTYGKYLDFLKGRDGHFCITVSAIGQMAMPGYCVYSASKFGTQGFQQGLRLELPENVTMTCLYPVATNTNFFKTANPKEFKKPFHVQPLLLRRAADGLHEARLAAAGPALDDPQKILRSAAEAGIKRHEAPDGIPAQKILRHRHK